MAHKFKIAGPIAIRVLNAFHFDAITTPWRTIYIRAEHFNDEPLRRHERAHIMQIDRDGAWYFWPKIVFDYFWYGYESSPYEIEARQHE